MKGVCVLTLIQIECPTDFETQLYVQSRISRSRSRQAKQALDDALAALLRVENEQDQC